MYPEEGAGEAVGGLLAEEGGYVCPYCGKRFRNKNSLAAHVRWCRKRRGESGEVQESSSLSTEESEGGGEGETAVSEAEHVQRASRYASPGLLVEDKSLRLEKILRDVLPKNKEKTIEYILDMFRSNEFYQTPTGLYHLLTLFKIDPGHIKLIVDYVFGPGTFQQVASPQTYGQYGAFAPQPFVAPHGYPQPMYVMTPMGPMPIIVMPPYQSVSPVPVVRRRRPVIDPETGEPLRDERGNVVYEEVEEPVIGAAQQQAFNVVDLIKLIREEARKEAEFYARLAEEYRKQAEDFRKQLLDSHAKFIEELAKIKISSEEEKLKTLAKAQEEVNKIRDEMIKAQMEWMKQRYEEELKRREEEHRREIEGLKAYFAEQLKDLKKDLEYAEKIRALESRLSLSEYVKRKGIDTFDDVVKGLREDIRDLKDVLKEYVVMQMKQRVAETRVPRVAEEEKRALVERLRKALGREEKGGGERREESVAEPKVVVAEAGGQ